jgi:hypothetical protein
LRRCNGDYSPADFIEHEVTAGENKLIGDPQNVVAAPPQFGVARGVVQLLLDCFVRRAVEFDNQAMLDAQKIDDETSDRNLPSEFQTVKAAGAQGAPEDNLGRRRILAKAAGERSLSGADASGHRSWSDVGAFPASAFKRRGPSSDPCFARVTFSRSREKESATGR